MLRRCCVNVCLIKFRFFQTKQNNYYETGPSVWGAGFVNAACVTRGSFSYYILKADLTVFLCVTVRGTIFFTTRGRGHTEVQYCQKKFVLQRFTQSGACADRCHEKIKSSYFRHYFANAFVINQLKWKWLLLKSAAWEKFGPMVHLLYSGFR